MRIEFKKALEYFKELRICVGEELSELALAREWLLHSLHVVQGIVVSEETHVLFVDIAQHLEYHDELVLLVQSCCLLWIVGGPTGLPRGRQWVAALARKQIEVCWLSGFGGRCNRVLPLHAQEHLGQYASDAPHVNGLIVVLLEENDLRGAVAARHDMVREATLILFPVLPLHNETIGDQFPPLFADLIGTLVV